MRRSIRCAVAVLTLAGVPLDSAAAQSAQFGLMAGGSLSTFTGDIVADAENYGSFIGGAFVRLAFAGFAVEPGAFYTAKGAKFEDEEISGTNKLTYLQVPVIIKFGFPLGGTSRIYVGAGPAIGFNLGCKFKATFEGVSASTDCEDLEDLDGNGISPKSTEFSGIAVAGLEFGKFALGLRGDFGMSNIYETFIDGNTAVEPEIRTRTISAVVSIKL